MPADRSGREAASAADAGGAEGDLVDDADAAAGEIRGPAVDRADRRIGKVQKIQGKRVSVQTILLCRFRTSKPYTRGFFLSRGKNCGVGRVEIGSNVVIFG